jgi:hypothetical protein
LVTEINTGVTVADLAEPMKVRIGENEVMFRTANERIELEAQSVDMFVTPVPFFCECPDLSCTETVELTLDEYEEIREGPTRFFCVPGHQALAVQANAAVVVEIRPDAVIADKIGIAGQIAAASYGQSDLLSETERP